MDNAVIARRGFIGGALSAGLALASHPRHAFAADPKLPTLMPHVQAVIERNVGPGKHPGALASFGLPGKEAEFFARGIDGFTDHDPITPDSLFRIYSMTKPITAMAAMMLIEESKLGLDQPVGDILPKYAKMQVQVTADGSLTDVRPAKSQITIRQLMTHTAGLGYAIVQNGPIQKALLDAGLSAGQVGRITLPMFPPGKLAPSLAAFADRLADLPLVYEPGTQWSYSLGLDLLGRVIEVVSGTPFDRFLKRRIFDPCGMTSTWFQVPRTEARRLSTNYWSFEGVLVPIDRGVNSIYLDKTPYPFGGSGLVSTARDYDRFLRMIAQYGKIGKERVLSEQTVRLATSDMLPPTITTQGTYAEGGGFGAGGRVGKRDEAGQFGWSGAAGTRGLVDMRRGVRAGLYVQFMPPMGAALWPEYQAALQLDLAAIKPR